MDFCEYISMPLKKSISNPRQLKTVHSKSSKAASVFFFLKKFTEIHQDSLFTPIL